MTQLDRYSRGGDLTVPDDVHRVRDVQARPVEYAAMTEEGTVGQTTVHHHYHLAEYREPRQQSPVVYEHHCHQHTDLGPVLMFMVVCIVLVFVACAVAALS